MVARVLALEPVLGLLVGQDFILRAISNRAIVRLEPSVRNHHDIQDFIPRSVRLQLNSPIGNRPQV